MKSFRINIYAILVFGFFIFGQSSLKAQERRFTEEEINTQKVFIDANREKILGNYEEAAVLYIEVLKRDKQNDAAAYELARVYDVLDKNEKALQSIKVAVAIDKENMWYQLFLADVYEKLERYKEAAKIYEKLAQSSEQKMHYHYTHWAYLSCESRRNFQSYKSV